MKKFVAIILTVLLLVSLSVNAIAVDFVPSRGGGKVIEIPTEDDDIVLVITPVSCKEDAMVSEIKDLLDSAEEQIVEADTVASLTGDIVSALEEFKAKSDDPAVKELKVEDLLVLDLFDVSLVKDSVRLEELPEGRAIVFSIQTDLSPDEVFFIVQNFAGGEWQVLNLYELHENGVLDIALFGLGPIAIIVDRAGEKGASTDEKAPTSPQTGDETPSTGIVAAVSSAVIGTTVAAVVIRKRKAAENLQ